MPDGDEEKAARKLAARIIAKPPLPVSLTKAAIRAIKQRSELGEVAYSDADLSLYSRLMQGPSSHSEP